MTEHCEWQGRPSLVKELKSQLRNIMECPSEQIAEIPPEKREWLRNFCEYSKYIELLEASDKTTADRVLYGGKPKKR